MSATQTISQMEVNNPTSQMEEHTKTVSKKQYDHLTKARQIKADKRDIKLKQAEAYSQELKLVHGHLDRLSTQFNTFVTAINGMRPAPVLQEPVVVTGKRRLEDDDDVEDVPTVKKQRTNPEEPTNNTQWINMIGQIIGASAAVGTVYIFKKIYGGDPDKQHVRNYDNFTL